MTDPNLAKTDSAKALENARRGAEAGLKAKLLDEKKITLDKHAGVEFQLEVPALGVYRSRVYVVDDRLYQVTVLGPKETATSKQADTVLDSFKLKK